jgi:hypothetical protein
VSDDDLRQVVVELNRRLRDEKALADDLADVMSHIVVGWENVIGHDLSQHPDVQRVMARYREARQ